MSSLYHLKKETKLPKRLLLGRGDILNTGYMTKYKFQLFEVRISWNLRVALDNKLKYTRTSEPGKMKVHKNYVQ